MGFSNEITWKSEDADARAAPAPRPRLGSQPPCPAAGRLLEVLIRLVWNASLPAGATIAPTAHFGHNALGVMVNRLKVIGPGCNIGVHVVLGGRTPIKGAPRLGSGVIVQSGAKLIGPITIGANA